MTREVERKDLPDILNIYNDAILNTAVIYTYHPQSLNEREVWFETKVLANEPIFVSEIDHKVAGFAMYGQFRHWPAYLYSIEHSIYVNKDYRRRGVTSHLLERLIDDVRHRQYRTIVAGIDTLNEASIKLHETLNFRHIGTIENIDYKFERQLDLAFYQYDLKADT